MKEMEYILAIVEEGGVSKAAEKLFLTQPALSRIVKRVENRLGISLFNKTNTPWTLTYAGELYLSKARMILPIEQSFLEKINSLVNKANKILTLGIMPFEEQYIFADILSFFKKKFPNYQLRIKTSTTGKVQELIISNDIDVGIITLPTTCDTIEYIPLKTYQLLLVLPINHALAKNYVLPKNNDPFPEIDLRLLAKEPFVLLEPVYSSRKMAIELCEKFSFTPKIAFSVATSNTVFKLVNEGHGATFQIDEMIKYLPPEYNFAYFRIKGEDLTQTVAFAYKKGRQLNKVEQSILKLLQLKTP